MGQKKLAHRSKVKPFIKVRSSHLYLSGLDISTSHWHNLQVVNYSHLFPTRYALELEGLKGAVTIESFKEPSQRENSKKTIKKLFEDRYTSGKNKWFFQPLRVRFSPIFFYYSHLTWVTVIVLILMPKNTLYALMTMLTCHIIHFDMRRIHRPSLLSIKGRLVELGLKFIQWFFDTEFFFLSSLFSTESYIIPLLGFL